MNQKDLSRLFQPSCVLEGQLLLIPPHEFRKIEGLQIGSAHVFILVCKGHITATINGKDHEMEECSFLDMLDCSELQIHDSSPNLKAWGLIPSIDFTRVALNRLKPFPEGYMLNRIYMPVITLSENDCITIERQFQLLESSISKLTHYYRHDLARTYFKSLMLELGNIALTYNMDGSNMAPAINKRDMIMMGFMRLVHKYYATQHGIGFYADKLCISAKHLSRVIREMMGKTPHDVISNELLQKAMEQLKDDKIQIQEISAALNFSDQASFCKFFKKHTGATPSEYRNFQTA